MILIIAALARNGVIGARNKLPWDLPEDLKRFREITSGHPIIMGRKTFESIGKPLPKRTNIVVTRDSSKKIEGCVVASSVEAAIEEARRAPGNEEIFVIGGGEIYKQALPYADRLYLTMIAHKVDGDAYFPKFDASVYREVSRETRTEPFKYEFVVLERS